MNKKCNKCSVDKNIDNFHKDKKTYDGYYSVCKECRKIESKIYYKNNLIKEKKDIKEKKCSTCNLVKKICEFHKQIGSKDGYRFECKECRRQKFTLNYENIKIKHRESSKNYRINNKEKYNNYRNKLYKKKPHIFAWRGMLRATLKRLGTKKEKNTHEILGYSAYDFKLHIEKLFLSGMTWENWGEWHIDHIKPVSSFDKKEDPKIVNSLTNIQPLWAKDNIIKSDKI